ncbi:MAG: SDR family oxidoreductase [bacterium]|nr:SDR family oxidoreductase [bacterium]
MKKYFDFSNKVVLVTGSTRGIGRVIAETFAKQGASVIINGRSGEDVQKIKDSFLEKGYSADGFAADISDKDAVQKLISKIKNLYGGLDVLINNAALKSWRPIEDIDDQSWEDVFRVNFLGVFHVIREAIPLLEHCRESSIVNISSIAAHKSPDCYNGINYIASKGALLSLTRGLAKELGPRGIRVNAVIPGTVDNVDERSIPKEYYARLIEDSFLKKLCTPHDIAHACLFLASPMAASITGEDVILGGF